MKNLKIIKQVTIAIVFSLTIMSKSDAQQVMHSFGLTLSVMQGTLQDGYGGSESFGVEQNNFTWFPRFNFTENENSSVSVGAPIGVGIGLVTNTYGSDVGTTSDSNHSPYGICFNTFLSKVLPGQISIL